MKHVHTPTTEEVQSRRRQAYLDRWPVSSQLEALTDAAQGNTDKLKQLMADIQAIKQTYPIKR